MDLLNIRSARAVWLFDTAELNPGGKSIMPELLEWMKDTYHFEKFPSSMKDVDEKTNALLFEDGNFQVREEIFVTVGLKIFNDGFVAETQSSTRDSEAFLDDGLRSAVKEFSLNFESDLIRMKLYGSEIYVRSDKNLLGINPNMSKFVSNMTSLIPGKTDIAYEMSGISCIPIASTFPHATFTPFRFERKLNTAPSQRRFYSSAPLHTDDHLKILNDFESQFMA